MAARRVTIDLPEESSNEIDRIREQTGLSIKDIFRHSFTLLRIYLEAKRKGEEMRIIGPMLRSQAGQQSEAIPPIA